jgi:hypothetical protein
MHLYTTVQIIWFCKAQKKIPSLRLGFFLDSGTIESVFYSLVNALAYLMLLPSNI